MFARNDTTCWKTMGMEGVTLSLIVAHDEIGEDFGALFLFVHMLVTRDILDSPGLIL